MIKRVNNKKVNTLSYTFNEKIELNTKYSQIKRNKIFENNLFIFFRLYIQKIKMFTN